jgi:hypothetical protein
MTAVPHSAPAKLTLAEWAAHYRALRRRGLREPRYGGPLARHVRDGDVRLRRLRFDNSPAALRLWNFLLSEEQRLHEARRRGHAIVGAMKDLGTIPVMAYALPNVTAFYPDGAWWMPCIMEFGSGVLEVADALGFNESFCPVRAMLGAFVKQCHFPVPDLLVCSSGAVCDDFSAIAQRLNDLGHPILWWEIPHRRRPEPREPAVTLPGGWVAPASQVREAREELARVRERLGALAGAPLDDARLAAGIRAANRVRGLLADLRRLCYTEARCPLPALETLVAEMLALHFCSDRREAVAVLRDLLAEVRRRVRAGEGVLDASAVRVYWVNPVADLQVMNLLEDCGGRIGGSDYMFCHALDPIPEDLDPLEALARMALADPMAGSVDDRAERIAREMRAQGAEALVVSRIPGGSHCAAESVVLAERVGRATGAPVQTIEVPPVTDALRPALATRLGALVETARARRR